MNSQVACAQKRFQRAYHQITWVALFTTRTGERGLRLEATWSLPGRPGESVITNQSGDVLQDDLQVRFDFINCDYCPLFWRLLVQENPPTYYRLMVVQAWSSWKSATVTTCFISRCLLFCMTLGRKVPADACTNTCHIQKTFLKLDWKVCINVVGSFYNATRKRYRYFVRVFWANVFMIIVFTGPLQCIRSIAVHSVHCGAFGQLPCIRNK